MKELNDIFKEPRCYWITGLSGSGKTTMANLLTDLIKKNNQSVIQLDGDILRKVLKSKVYSYEERKELGLQYSRFCQLLVSQGVNVVIGVIGLFHDLHSFNRKNITNYIEIFLDTPLEELKRRDVKGIYKDFENGTINNVSGIDIKAEFPISPDVKVEWRKEKNVDATFKEIISKLKNYSLNLSINNLNGI